MRNDAANTFSGNVHGAQAGKAQLRAWLDGSYDRQQRPVQPERRVYNENHA